jgi:hypothetical protein
VPLIITTNIEKIDCRCFSTRTQCHPPEHFIQLKRRKNNKKQSNNKENQHCNLLVIGTFSPVLGCRYSSTGHVVVFCCDYESSKKTEGKLASQIPKIDY